MSSKILMPSMERMSDNASFGREYEVFLSFRGPDTRAGFTDHLYMRLINAGIRVYRDDEELRVGEEISLGLLKGIKESKIAIPIFSKGYASSKWCLKELVEITKWKQFTGLKVMPIFYYVTPSEVRNQTEDYEKDFESHKKYYDEKTIQEWREALRHIGQLKGWEIQIDKNRREGKLVGKVVKTVLRELKRTYTIVTDYLVGVEHHVEAILNMINNEDNGVQIVGIYGMGGIGKTTLAKVIYNHLLPRYEGHSFLGDIRETSLSKGMELLQKKMIFDIFKIKWNINDVDEGIGFISDRFVNKKVLIILDDVDSDSQFKGLIGKREWFGPKSRIIVTTRNKGILDSIEVDHSYELTCLNSQQALQLFSRHAFRSNIPPKEYTTLSEKVIQKTGGLPLALEIIGSLLYRKGKNAWGFTLEKLEKVPNEEVRRKLKISFDSLDNQQQQIFLDIACFFIGANIRLVIHFWKDGNHFPEEAIEVLQQLSLIKIQKDNTIWIHDQLRDMGRDIVREEHGEPEKRSRLWNPEEATDFLMRRMGHENVRGICLNFRQQRKFPNEEFAQLPSLRLLYNKSVPMIHEHFTSNRCHFSKNWFSLSEVVSKIFSHRRSPILTKLRFLSWPGFSQTYETYNFSLENLVILNLSCSNIETDWSGWRCIKMAKKLKVLDLSKCLRLLKTPDFSSHPLLEQLILEGCIKLVEIDTSVSMLKHLVIMNLKECCSLRKLPKQLNCTQSLEELTIENTSISEIPDWPGMKRLAVFSASRCYSLNKVSSLNFGTCLLRLSLAHCKGLQTLPQSIGNLVCLEELDLSFSGMVELPDTIGNLKNLNSLRVRRTPITELPADIGKMENLKRLDATECDHMIKLPKFPKSLISLNVSCRKLEMIPDFSNLIHLRSLELLWVNKLIGSIKKNWSFDWIKGLTKLENLGLGFPQVKTLNTDLAMLPQLKRLKIFSCYELQTVPKLPSSLTSLSILNCKSLQTLLDLPQSLTELEITSCRSLRTSLVPPSGLMKLIIQDTYIRKLEGLRRCKSLQQLDIINCGISEIDGLETLESLTRLVISECKQLQELPDLSNLSKLKELEVSSCTSLVRIPGRLESLEICCICDCKSLIELPVLPNYKSMREFTTKNVGNDANSYIDSKWESLKRKTLRELPKKKVEVNDERYIDETWALLQRKTLSSSYD